ncbi:MAG TPA: hypothetical protein VK053_24245 [Jiangellaceae bacterium]|nr:hypothetical protein [Jiangellaceae bacterium]
MGSYEVHAVWRDGGWDIDVPEVGAGRTTSLGRVRRAAHSLIAAATADSGDVSLVVKPFVGGIEDEVLIVKKEIEDLAVAQIRVAQHSRDLARTLREKGLSGADIAVVLGVSPQRVSQLKHT